MERKYIKKILFKMLNQPEIKSIIVSGEGYNLEFKSSICISIDSLS